jgi:uncharacterized membrane protein YobD (UPF0266 family)
MNGRVGVKSQGGLAAEGLNEGAACRGYLSRMSLLIIYLFYYYLKKYIFKKRYYKYKEIYRVYRDYRRIYIVLRSRLVHKSTARSVMLSARRRYTT